jgi:hypothetical protein
MDEKIIQDILTDVFASLEPLDAQCDAILQFLKAKGFATDKELAPFLEQAANASNVRWLAARIRIRSLISSAMKTTEEDAVPAGKRATPQPETQVPEQNQKVMDQKNAAEAPQAVDSRKEESQPVKKNNNNSNSKRPEENAA